MSDPGYSPDPPSRHNIGDQDDGTTTTDQPVSGTTPQDGYVSGRIYTQPPHWFLPDGIGRDELMRNAQEAADQSGVHQIVHERDGRLTQVDPV